MIGNKNEGLWTVQDVAEYLQLAPNTIRNKVQAKQIPHVKIGGALRFRPSEIARWVEVAAEKTASAV